MSHAIALPSTTVHDLATMDPLKFATMGFLARYKGRTLEAYTLDLRSYFGWCESVGLRPLQATRPHLELFIRWMEQVPYASATISRRYNTVALLYVYAARDGIISKDPSLYVERPQVDRDGQRRTYLTPLEHGVFLAAAQHAGIMENALVTLLAMRGLRIAEACSLDVDSITVENGYDVIHFIGKGGGRASLSLPVPVMRAVRLAVGDRTSGPLLLNQRGRRMDRRCADRIIKQIAAAAKVNTDISPHSLRRSFVTTSIAMGTPLRDVQLSVRHRSPSTTAIYDRRGTNPDRDSAHRVAGYLAGMAG